MRNKEIDPLGLNRSTKVFEVPKIQANAYEAASHEVSGSARIRFITNEGEEYTSNNGKTAKLGKNMVAVQIFATRVDHSFIKWGAKKIIRRQNKKK